MYLGEPEICRIWRWVGWGFGGEIVGVGTVDVKSGVWEEDSSLLGGGEVDAQLDTLEVVGVAIGQWDMVMTVGLSWERWLVLMQKPLRSVLVKLVLIHSPNGTLPVKNGGLFILAIFVIVCWPPPATATLIRQDRS